MYRVTELGLRLFLGVVFATVVSSCAHADAAKKEEKHGEKYAGIKVLEGGYVVDSKPIPFEESTLRELRRRGYSTIFLATPDGIAVFSANGKPIPPQCKLENGRVPDKCGLEKVTIKSLFNITVGTYQVNPHCTFGTIGPYVAIVHSGGDGHPQGAFPCHNGGGHH